MTLEEYKEKKHELWEADRALDDEYSRANFGIGHGMIVKYMQTGLTLRARVDHIVVSHDGRCTYSGPRINANGTKHKKGIMDLVTSDRVVVDNELSKAV
jgi:hypothetical protein